MPATIAVRQVHPDLPTGRVWQQGRRLYARCGRSSRLSTAMHAMGARWDVKEQALWVGSGKREAFTPLALDHQAVLERLENLRAAGHWVDIPFHAELIRARAKDMGGIWDPDLKQWALPTPADHIEILDLVQVWQQARDAERAERARAVQEQREIQRREAEIQRREAAWEAAEARQEAALEEAGARERARREAARTAEGFRAELARQVGRTLTGHTEHRREVFPRFTDGDAARAAALEVGAVIRMEDGRRALVCGSRVGYIPREDAGVYGQDRAHWYVKYQLAVVVPDESELDQEGARAVEEWDADELRVLVEDAELLTFPAAGDRWTPLADAQGAILVTAGVNGLIPAGRLVLDRDGALWWQHPGHYDTYVRSEGCTRDPDLVARMRRVLADGPRRRTVAGSSPRHYEVTTGA